MKKLLLAVMIATMAISCSGDSKSDNGTTPTPGAKAEFDSSNLGLYKGVFVGSSGVITLNIKNDGAVNAKLVLDGVTFNFTTSETVGDSGDISNLTFISGDKSFDISISGNGENVTASAINFPGHPNATLNILKEYSDQVVHCYEGTFTGSSTGILNVMTVDNFVSGLAFPTGAEDAYFLEGTRTESNMTGTYGEPAPGDGGTFTGTISGNNISGAWQSTATGSSDSGTWTATRTL